MPVAWQVYFGFIAGLAVAAITGWARVAYARRKRKAAIIGDLQHQGYTHANLEGMHFNVFWRQLARGELRYEVGPFGFNLALELVPCPDREEREWTPYWTTRQGGRRRVSTTQLADMVESATRQHEALHSRSEQDLMAGRTGSAI